MQKFKLENIDGVGYSLIALYESVAKQMGEDCNAENIRFDCTKINVAKSIYAQMEDAAIAKFGETHGEEGVRNEFAMMWCMSGPKAVPHLASGEIEVLDGFVTYT